MSVSTVKQYHSLLWQVSTGWISLQNETKSRSSKSKANFTFIKIVLFAEKTRIKIPQSRFHAPCFCYVGRNSSFCGSSHGQIAGLLLLKFHLSYTLRSRMFILVQYTIFKPFMGYLSATHLAMEFSVVKFKKKTWCQDSKFVWPSFRLCLHCWSRDSNLLMICWCKFTT